VVTGTAVFCPCSCRARTASTSGSQIGFGRTREPIVHELERLDFAGEIPPPLEMRVAIPSADPEHRLRRFEMKSFEIVSTVTGEAVSATITPILEVADSEEQSPSEGGVTEAKPGG
jgi:hypothetical protein